MAKRQYSDEDKAAALAALDMNEGNVSKTAKQLKIPRVTLIEWRDGRVNDNVSEIRQDKKGSLAELFESIVLAYATRALDEDAIADTKGKDAVIAMGTAFDKLQLALGKPTERVHNDVDIDLSRLSDAQLRALADSLKD